MQSVSSLKPKLWEILIYKIDKKKKEGKEKKKTHTNIDKNTSQGAKT